MFWWLCACIESTVTSTVDPESGGPPVYDATTWDRDHDGSVDADDCKPADPDVHPGADERCNGVDDDCDGKLDEGEWDADGDGFDSALLCYGQARALDCRDDDADVHPGAPDPCDYVDQDCDGEIDEDDLDGDGALGCDDCDDGDAFVHPGAAEVCDDIDNDCDDEVDEGWDFDGDGYGECQGDCEPDDATIGPGADEVCDGIDNDCDAAVDEDDDRDADGVPTCEGDCDDGEAAVYPGADEGCDGLDNDCDAGTDEAVDADGDGYTICGGDCDETSAAAHPGGAEACDGVDNDCNGHTDEDYSCYGCTASGSLLYCSASVTWPVAEAACEAFGGTLAILGSSSENSDVADLAARPAWIGANDRDVEGTWMWPDASTVGYDDWAAGFPTGSDAADCAYTNHGGRRGEWADTACSSGYPFVCEL